MDTGRLQLSPTPGRAAQNTTRQPGKRSVSRKPYFSYAYACTSLNRLVVQRAGEGQQAYPIGCLTRAGLRARATLRAILRLLRATQLPRGNGTSSVSLHTPRRLLGWSLYLHKRIQFIRLSHLLFNWNRHQYRAPYCPARRITAVAFITRIS